MRLEWRSRPFFYAALVWCFGLFISDRLLPELPGPDSVIYAVSDDALFLGGTVVSEVERRERPFGGESTSFVLNAERLWEDLERDGRKVDGRVRVSWNDAPPELGYGNVVVLQGVLAEFSGRRNPGGFDARAYWRNQKVRAAFYVAKKPLYKFLNRSNGNYFPAGGGSAFGGKAFIINLKQTLSKQLDKDFEKWQAAFLQALFLGEKSGLDDDLKDLFLKTGTLHILAVSGFNIGFLTAVIWLLLRPIPVPRDVKLTLMILGVWFYCALVGWQAPVMRASVMATVMLLGRFSGRKPDGLNMLGLSACVILAWNGRQLFDVGFQLSYLAVLGLIVFAPFFTKRPELLPHERWTLGEKSGFAVKELFWTSFICYGVTLPVVLRNFYVLTPYALIANLFVVPLSFLIFLFGFVYFLTVGWVPSALSAVPWLMKLWMSLMVKALFLIENIPGAVMTVGSAPIAWTLALAAGIFYFLWEPRLQTRRGRFLLVVLFILNALTAQELWRQTHRRFEMTMLDVGQGDAVYFEFPKGGNLLVDGGGARFSDQGRRAVTPFLRSKGVRSLETVLISHPQEDHIGGLMSVLEEFRVRRVVYADRPYDSALWRDVQARVHKEGSETWRMEKGMTVEGYPGIRLESWHPAPGVLHKNINDDSVVFRLQYGDTAFLMTGDVQTPAMRQMLAQGQVAPADVLKVPHHGAKLTPEGAAFVNAVRPKFSLISAGLKNPFGHPRLETLQALEAIEGNQVLVTARQGAICLVSDGRRVTLDGLP